MSSGHSPLAQFEITPLVSLPPLMGYDISFTNSSLFMVLALVSVWLFFEIAMKSKALVPGRLQSVAEMSYEFIGNMIRDNAGKEGRQFFPIVFTLFIFVLACNLWGMVPYSFTVTSHIVITFALALFIFVGVTLVALYKHGLKFFGFFLPHGTPMVMAPVMYLIELFSYLARPVSLSVRLAANMMAGHTMLKVIAGFVIMLLNIGGIVGMASGTVPLALLIVLTGFEIFVAVLQAYIFTILTCVYLNDALHLH